MSEQDPKIGGKLMTKEERQVLLREYDELSSLGEMQLALLANPTAGVHALRHEFLAGRAKRRELRVALEGEVRDRDDAMHRAAQAQMDVTTAQLDRALERLAQLDAAYLSLQRRVADLEQGRLADVPSKVKP